MKKIILLICLSLMFSQELKVEGDLNVTGAVINDNLAQVIAAQQQLITQLQAQIIAMQAQINYLSSQLGYTDCSGIIGGTAILDECGVCHGNGTIDYYHDCNGDCYYDFDEDDICDIFEETNIVSDFDGNMYETVTIGGQIWLKENLRATHYQNGDDIEFDYYADDPVNSMIYGIYIIGIL
jgi:hypothetical protein